MSEHHNYSPSGGPRLVRCVGSHFLEALRKDEGSNPYADDGSASHTFSSTCILERKRAIDLLGQTVEIAGVTYVMDEERAGFVQVYLDLVTEKYDSYLKRGATRVELRVEQRVHIQGTGVAGQYGTADVMLIVFWPAGDITIEVIDLKYGRGVRVDAEGNEQLMLYGVGALDEVDLLGDIREVVLTISQPRLGHVSEWVITAPELRAFATSYGDVVRYSEKIHARGYVEPKDLVPGDKQCRFCNAKAVCPALAAAVERETKADFSDLTAPAPISDDNLAHHMKMVDLIESWCKAIRGEVETRLLAGDPVDGFKLVAGRRGARAWRNAGEAETVLKAMRLRDDQVYDFKLISPTTAEKLAKAEVIGPRQWPKLQELIHQPDGSPSVAPVSDKRPAFSPIAAVAEFESLT